MVTLTSLLAEYSFPPAFTIACTAELSPILILTEISATDWGDNSNNAASGVGLFTTTTPMAWTSARSVLTVTGTTAPFSAISGIFSLIWSLSVMGPSNMSLMAAAASYASNAASGRAANNQRGTASTAAAVNKLFSRALRCNFIE
jgi:hypothetical protein